MEHLYLYLADLVLLLHALLVVFVVAALLLTVVGGYSRWRWVRNRGFRWVHLVAIAGIVMQSWLGLVCPLTSLEMWLRGQIGGGQYDGSFMHYWLQRLLYYDVPDWWFVVAYSTFGLLVVITWLRVPPQKNSDRGFR